ncbi:hypothetical protein SDC9_208356 [bioreactor metagenome]|uniref:ABC transporter ATP-binding protein n=1 Tax=bioreactor metagenome TaxID=1076179 RepID=A0A645JB44_9ZZZZ
MMVTHNPDHALLCADKTIIMKGGKVVDIGETRSVTNEASMKDIYQTNVKITKVDVSQQKKIFVCVPVSNPNFALDRDQS